MSYQVLARKWRPRTFTEVVGQEHVTRALCNAIQLGRLHHAYLFTGTRGVGKTTLARILAAALNCESGVVVEPCGKCQSCKEIRSGRFIDLIEVDAASRSGVEDMRDLLDTVQYAAAAGRFKIYLVDEVHMLSNSSFNALLKTLEEPPSHAKFFFATTDPQKIPATVLSRCLQFNLIRLSHERIADYLANRLTTEDVRYENEALLELAVAADGSMRDALSLLDQALAYGAGELSQEVVENTLGITARANLPRLVRALVAGDSQAIFSEIGEMHRSAADFSAALDDLLSLFHELAVQQVLPETTPSHRFPLKEIVALSRSVSANDVQLYYQIAVKSRQDMLFLSDQRSVFEMALLRMLCFRPLFAEVTVSAGTQQESFAAHSGSETIVSRGNRAGDAVASAPVHGQAVSQETSGYPASVRQESNVETSAQDRDATTRPGLSPRSPLQGRDDVATSAQDRDATTRPPDLSPRFPTRQRRDDVATSAPDRDATIRPGLSPRPPCKGETMSQLLRRIETQPPARVCPQGPPCNGETMSRLLRRIETQPPVRVCPQGPPCKGETMSRLLRRIETQPPVPRALSPRSPHGKKTMSRLLRRIETQPSVRVCPQGPPCNGETMSQLLRRIETQPPARVCPQGPPCKGETMSQLLRRIEAQPPARVCPQGHPCNGETMSRFLRRIETQPPARVCP